MQAIDKKAITAIRVLAAEAVQKANSGHPGLPIGAAPMAYALFQQMKHNPRNPSWQARDRFVLSAGHASMLQYALLHLFGYGLTMDDIKDFRQWGSKTPGHPEFGHTIGVEATSGPLGQGIATAVGMAMAEAHLAATFNREGYPIVDNFTYVLLGDGCMMEGVASEAASMAGTLKLGKLIALYDSNRITIEGSTDITFCEDVGARFEAYGWHVQTITDGEDIDAIRAALDAAKAETQKPSLLIVNTKIAYGTPYEGQAKAHGAPLGQDNIDIMKKNFGWDYDAFTVPEDVYSHFDAMQPGFAKQEADWNALFASYEKAYPELAQQWKQWHEKTLPESVTSGEAFGEFTGKSATRSASGVILNRLSDALPNLFGGSADLGPSNKSELKGKGDFSCDDYRGKNIHFGIREFAMAAACNGMMLYGGLRAYCATFCVFSDYLKPALRLSALMNLPVIYVLTHDSIGVGEDGPTHQPIEHYAALRATPNTIFFRPADAKETVAGYVAALEANGPTALALTRQDLPVFENTGMDAKKGAYILKDSEGTPDIILMASGSEVELVLKAAEQLSEKNIQVRVVSMPSFELFERQTEEYKQSVLPNAVRARLAVEAASGFGWHKYTGLDGAVVSLDHFGASAPANILFEKFGFTVENVVESALKVINK